MKLEAVQLRTVRMPLVRPFRTSFGTQEARTILLVRALGPDGEGWGECVAGDAPVYSSEYVDAARHVLRHHLVPRLLAAGDVGARQVTHVLGPVRGHRMAKGALEMAVLDAELRAAGQSLATALGAVRDRVPSGVSVGIPGSVGQLLEWVQEYVDEGYARIKLKIEPGFDLEPVAAVRERFGGIALQVDANAAYSLADARHLAKLDRFDLLLVEQPLPEEAVLAHASLARTLRTPVCLDESILSAASAADAITLGACGVVNIKAGRVGGYLEAVRVHDVATAHGVPVWCGGMVETGLARAANAALAALPGFALPGDISASARFWAHDIVTEPTTVTDGTVAVPHGPGLGVEVDADALAEVTVETELIRR